MLAGIGARLAPLDRDYWFDRDTWSSLLAFLVLAALSLLIGLPASQPVQEAAAAPSWHSSVFPTAFVVFYGILALTLGQTEVRWEGRLAGGSALLHLVGRELFALGLTLPFWISHLVAYSLRMAALGGIFLHLGVYGAALGLLGWRLGLTRRSEIFQFNVKYVSFFTLLLASALVPGLGLLNPVAPLDALLWGSAGGLRAVLISELLWIGVGAAAAGWVKRRATA